MGRWAKTVDGMVVSTMSDEQLSSFDETVNTDERLEAKHKAQTQQDLEISDEELAGLAGGRAVESLAWTALAEAQKTPSGLGESYGGGIQLT